MLLWAHFFYESFQKQALDLNPVLTDGNFLVWDAGFSVWYDQQHLTDLDFCLLGTVQITVSQLLARQGSLPAAFALQNRDSSSPWGLGWSL